LQPDLDNLASIARAADDEVAREHQGNVAIDFDQNVRYG